MWSQLNVTREESKPNKMVKQSLGKILKGIADRLSGNNIKGRKINSDRPKRQLSNAGHWIGGSGPE